jgi:hypothetical protein
MHRIVVFILILCSFAFANGGHSGSHSSRQHSSKPHSAKVKEPKNKSVHVRGYTRKDGTYVAPYDRSAPGTASPSLGGTSRTTIGQPYRSGYIASGHAAHASVTLDRHGKIKRSAAAKAAFERQSPCPSTGKTSGRCPGYVVDHVNPLECGGADSPSNMQWQTTIEGKAKDKTERSCRM